MHQNLSPFSHFSHSSLFPHSSLKPTLFLTFHHSSLFPHSSLTPPFFVASFAALCLTLPHCAVSTWALTRQQVRGCVCVCVCVCVGVGAVLRGSHSWRSPWRADGLSWGYLSPNKPAAEGANCVCVCVCEPVCVQCSGAHTPEGAPEHRPWLPEFSPLQGTYGLSPESQLIRTFAQFSLNFWWMSQVICLFLISTWHFSWMSQLICLFFLISTWQFHECLS